MRRTARRIGAVFAAGALGGLVNSILLWMAGDSGLTAKLGVAVAPHLSPAWLYPRIVWGGLWGLLFLASVYRGRPWVRGAVLSLAPTLFQLLVVFPYMQHKGWLGLSLGTLTPAVVLVLNAAWGVTASVWLDYVRE